MPCIEFSFLFTKQTRRNLHLPAILSLLKAVFIKRPCTSHLPNAAPINLVAISILFKADSIQRPCMCHCTSNFSDHLTDVSFILKADLIRRLCAYYDLRAASNDLRSIFPSLQTRWNPVPVCMPLPVCLMRASIQLLLTRLRRRTCAFFMRY